MSTHNPCFGAKIRKVGTCIPLQTPVLLQYNLIITLCLGSKDTDGVICEPCYNEVIYYMHYKKIVIWEPCHGRVILETML